jgi:hypothetical protein
MLDYRSIRARYELAIRDALLPLDVPLHYDNVQEQPIPTEGSITEYATITISFPSSTEPDLCGGVVFIRGNVQVNMYAPRMGGMMRLEQMAAAVVCALMSIGDYPDPDNVRTSVQSIQGPTPILGGQDPQAATVVSAPFTARVGEAGISNDGTGSGGGSGSGGGNLPPHSLNDHLDVDVSGAADGNTLIYDAAQGKWVNKPGVDGGDVDTP